MRSLDDTHINSSWEKFLAYRDRRICGINTGLVELDKYLLGLGGITTIQGETSSGKSTLALQIVHHNLKEGASALIVDKENGEGRLRSRLLCQANQVSETEVMVCEVDKLKKYARAVKDYPLHIYTEPMKNQDVVRERTLECLNRYDKPMILLIDSLQKMTPVDADQRINLEKWLVWADSLKLECDGKLTILITSEINRNGMDRVGVGVGKGTNSIEFSSETLLDLRAAGEGGNDVALMVCKHRDGLKGARFTLEKVLSDSENPRSFTFTYRGIGDLEV